MQQGNQLHGGTEEISEWLYREVFALRICMHEFRSDHGCACAASQPYAARALGQPPAGSYGDHSHTKIAPLPSKLTYIKMDPLRSIRNGFAMSFMPLTIEPPLAGFSLVINYYGRFI